MERMKFKKINISIAVHDRSNPVRLAEIVEELIEELKTRGIGDESIGRGGVTFDPDGSADP